MRLAQALVHEIGLVLIFSSDWILNMAKLPVKLTSESEDGTSLPRTWRTVEQHMRELRRQLAYQWCR